MTGKGRRRNDFKLNTERQDLMPTNKRKGGKAESL
jgi:hypothetical protein